MLKLAKTHFKSLNPNKFLPKLINNPINHFLINVEVCNPRSSNQHKPLQR